MQEDSGGCGFRRGGLGYDKRIRSLGKSRLISNADRSVLSCYGVNGGKASKSYQVSVLKNQEETVYPGMCDSVVVEENNMVRIVTTGGGGWGDPLLREIDNVVYDLQCGLISERSARDDYGVSVSLVGRKWQADIEESAKLRKEIKSRRGKLAMFDRGSKFSDLSKRKQIKIPDGWVDPDKGWYAK